MLKRELGVAAADVVLDGPRAKRSRNVSGESGGSGVSGAGAVKDKDGDGDVEMKDDVVVGGGGGGDNGGSGMTKEEVREKGVEVWQIVKGAVNKENRTLSADFLRLPSKRQYPDYYTLIKRPIALEDIHTNLDKLKYPTLEALRADFEVCFKNAKKYNVRESQIWRDAKTLQKIATKEIDKILHPNEDEHVDVDGSDEDGDGTSKKKKKAPNMTRLMKSRLQKLVGRKDDDGRQLSNVFMDLPSKKKWPLYYKTIKRPICIEDIFKRIKRKEYETIADFMEDVELVFANALQFNDDHSPIWEDAVLLRDYFRKLMQELPPPFTLHGTQADVAAYLSAAASSPDAGGSKIMLKLPHQQQQHGASGSGGGESAKAGVTLRVPATPAGGAGPGSHVNGAAAPVVNGTTKSVAGGATGTTPATAKQTGGGTTKGGAKQQQQQQQQQQHPQIFAPQQQQQQHAASVTPGGYYNTGHYTPHSYYPSQAGSGSTGAVGSTSARPSSLYPHASSTSHLPAASNLNYSTSTSTNATTNATTTITANSYAHNSLSLTPPITESARTLRSARLRVRVGSEPESVGRCVLLSEKEGVRSWVVRLARGETGVVVDKVVGDLGDAEDEIRGGKRRGARDDDGSEGEEEEEEEESEEEVVVRRGRKGKGKAASSTATPTRAAAGRSVSPAKGGKGKKVERVKTRRAARDEKAGVTRGAREGEGEEEEGGGEVYVKMDGVVVERVCGGVGVGVDKDKDKEKDKEGDKKNGNGNGKDVDMDTGNEKEDESEEKGKGEMEKWSIDVPIGSHVLELGQKGGAPWRVYLERRV